MYRVSVCCGQGERMLWTGSASMFRTVCLVQQQKQIFLRRLSDPLICCVQGERMLCTG